MKPVPMQHPDCQTDEPVQVPVGNVATMQARGWQPVEPVAIEHLKPNKEETSNG